MHDMLNQAESQAANFQKDLNTEKKLREKVESLSSDFHKSLLNVTDTLEKTKIAFNEEKAALLKRAEEAESKLEPVTQELSTLKGHITDMCNAIFGKHKTLQVTKCAGLIFGAGLLILANMYLQVEGIIT
jgi:hypothetical protein